MKKNYKNEKRKYENNVIYQISIGEYDYIGQTSRPLEMRVQEHINSKKSPIHQYIKNHNAQEMNIKIIQHLPSEKKLDRKETKAIARYIIRNGKKKSYKQLLNVDFKGLDTMSMKELKDLARNY